MSHQKVRISFGRPGENQKSQTSSRPASTLWKYTAEWRTTTTWQIRRRSSWTFHSTIKPLSKIHSTLLFPWLFTLRPTQIQNTSDSCKFTTSSNNKATRKMFGLSSLAKIQTEARGFKLLKNFLKLRILSEASASRTTKGLQSFKNTWRSPYWFQVASVTLGRSQCWPQLTVAWRATCTVTATSAPHLKHMIWAIWALDLCTWQTMQSRKTQRTTASLRTQIKCPSMTFRGIWTRTTPKSLFPSCEIYSQSWSDSWLTHSGRSTRKLTPSA
jgi:hypothetical protein